MAENGIRIHDTPNGPQVYLGNVRIHHWQAGAAVATIGGLGLLFDDNKNRKNQYSALLVAGIFAFLHDLPDFIAFLDGLRR